MTFSLFLLWLHWYNLFMYCFSSNTQRFLDFHWPYYYIHALHFHWWSSEIYKLVCWSSQGDWFIKTLYKSAYNNKKFHNKHRVLAKIRKMVTIRPLHIIIPIETFKHWLFYQIFIPVWVENTKWINYHFALHHRQKIVNNM